MEGLKFDIEVLELGMPIRWKTVNQYGESRIVSDDKFGLVAGVCETAITIMAYDSNRVEFWEKRYDIEEIAEFEILGKWEHTKEEK